MNRLVNNLFLIVRIEFKSIKILSFLPGKSNQTADITPPLSILKIVGEKS